MTRKEALHILIQHAANDCMGAGCGPGHQIPPETERVRVAQAVAQVWPEKHYGPKWFELGLPDPHIS